MLFEINILSKQKMDGVSSEMQHQVMGYDRAATMFSPEGHLLQVEYAEKTVRLGSASIGMTCSDGVFILSDRRIKDVLMQTKFTSKIWDLDSHIIASAAGILSDARILIEKARLICQQHRAVYDSPIDVETVMKEIANVKQLYTQYGGVRPFGVSIMIAGISNKEPLVFISDVTGNYFGYKATAIGENDEKIKDILRKKYDEKITIKEGIKLGISIFKEVLDKNFDMDKLDCAYISTEKEVIERLKGEELKKLIK